ncbi:MAG TPA: hypothetical protein EYO33_30560 [Phycisphaerales bacterium]|nr:hypothetical protein [Phycisphaerales bacterium]
MRSETVERRRTLTLPFHSIKASVLRVTVNGAEDQEDVVLIGEANVLDQIQTRVEGSTLLLGPAPGSSFSTNERLEIRLSHSRLEAIQASAGATVQVDSFHGGRLTLQAVSGARITVEGQAAAVVAKAESGGTVNIGHLSSSNVQSQTVSGGRVIA